MKVKTNDKQCSNNIASFSHKSKGDYCLTSKIFSISDSERKRAYGFEKKKKKKPRVRNLNKPIKNFHELAGSKRNQHTKVHTV